MSSLLLQLSHFCLSISNFFHSSALNLSRHFSPTFFSHLFCIFLLYSMSYLLLLPRLLVSQSLTSYFPPHPYSPLVLLTFLLLFSFVFSFIQCFLYFPTIFLLIALLLGSILFFSAFFFFIPFLLYFCFTPFASSRSSFNFLQFCLSFPLLYSVSPLFFIFFLFFTYFFLCFLASLLYSVSR